MTMQKFKILTKIFLLSLIVVCGHAQSLDRAKMMYNNGEYEEAKPVFEKLVKQSPNNSSYNQWFGVCCYETGELEKAEKYLLVANKRKVLDSYIYLSKIYNDTYRYGKSIEKLEEYIDLQKKKKGDISKAEIMLGRAKKLLRMQENTEDVQVIDTIVIDKDRFLEAYHLSEESGSLELYNDFFNEQGYNSTVFKNQKKDKIYYARPSKTGTYSLYSQTKLLDAWSDEKQLLPNNNSDNNYPYVLSDGVTMYFASNGDESIGGYDIFVTRYNMSSNTFLAPEQMGMPFNSTANDYMMVIDETKGLGWFVSDRNQPEGQVCVYLFIPDESRKRIGETDDEDMLRSRAALASIKDTWKNGKNYDNLIQLALTEPETKNIQEKRDFEFIVNDRTTYYTLNDIKNREAKEIYSGVIKLNKQIDALNKKLDEARTQYVKGNTSAKEQLRASILQAEKQLNHLMEQAKLDEKKARNAENRHIGHRN